LFMFVAWLTNPDMEDFKKESGKKVWEALEKKGFTSDNGLVKDMANAVIEQVMKNSVTRKNYYVCSVYTLNLSLVEYRYLAAFSMFFPLQNDDPIVEMLKQ
jgi:Domain of unknown function (DUF4359)